MGTYVSDDVWRQLDPHAGRLSRRTAARLWIASALAVLLVAATIAGWSAGLLVPALKLTGGSSYELPETGPVVITVGIENAGLRPVTILAAGRSGPGLDLIGNGGSVPVTVGPGEMVNLTFVYRITDCDAALGGGTEFPVRVQRFWGEQTFTVRDRFADRHLDWVELWCDPP